ncbi:hypothetical protein [Patiriisocius hiemis]|uniref:Lipoprotein n=1 Tax=Patiriisocius hiemis TaxID=3075604 RepID=A0ABU2YDU2_9FLAO|nr:hypothetical protein [Constantimarinum sp. W242]MDT0556357.1 hypothetical protein [Constantimarinum sp. W242]
MKQFKLYLIALLLVVLSCSKDDENNPQNDFSNFTSQICENAVGVDALYWDYSNALPVPLTQIPTIQNPGEFFIHSAYPQLGFTLPQGYTAFEISQNNPPAVGVDVIRNDNNVIWRYVPLVSFQGNVGINDVVASQVNSMFNFHNFNSSNFNVICSETKTSNSGGLQFTFGARLIEFGNFTGLVWVNTLYVPSVDSTSISVSISSAPTAEFDNEVFNTFLPISFQLLVIDDEVRDTDLDGVPDNQDADPFDPNVQ